MDNKTAGIVTQIGFAITGAAVGFAFGNPALGFAVGTMLGGITSSLLFPAEGENSSSVGPRLSDLSVQTSTYGNAIPVLYGTNRVAGNVIWSTGLIEHVNTVTEEAPGGKGGSDPPTSSRTTYTYSASFAVSLCNNPMIGIKRIWADDKLWYDFAHPPVGVNFASEQFYGSETQLPCTAIEADKGVGNVPAHRGQSYIVFKNLQLAEFGNRLPNFHFEVVCQGSSALVPDYYQDSAPSLSGWFTRLALDRETGLIWLTRSSQNRVVVMTTDGDIVHESVNEISAPNMISYQPPYAYVSASFPGATPTLKEMEPRMWVSSAVWDILSIGGIGCGSIDTRDYQMRLCQNMVPPFPYFVWLGAVEVDMRGINVNYYQIGGKQRVVFGGSNVNSILYPVEIGRLGGNGYHEIIPAQTIATNHSNDLIAIYGVEYMYVINSEGDVHALNEDYFIEHTRSVSDDFAGSFNRGVFDKATNKLFVIMGEWPSGKTFLVKLSADLSVEHWRVERSNIEYWVTLDVHPQTGALYAISRDFGGTWRLHEMDKNTGAYLTDYVVVGSEGRIWMDMVIYPYSNFAVVTYVGPFVGHGIARVPLTPSPTGAQPTLQAVVEDICIRTGLTLGDISATGLAGSIVRGYILAHRMTARSAIEPLMRGYFFDAVESDYICKFVKRGAAAVKTVSFLDVGATEPGKPSDSQRVVNRQEENSMPWQVDVQYTDEQAFYKTNNQYARRLVGQSRIAVQAQIPVVFTATEAKRIADTILFNKWMARNSSMIKTTRKHLDLDPTDVINYTIGPNLAILDDFERPNEDPVKGWTLNSGDGAKVVGGTLVTKNVAQYVAVVYDQPLYPNIELEVTIHYPVLTAVGGLGMAARCVSRTQVLYTTGDYHIEVIFGNYDDGGTLKGLMYLFKVVNGVLVNYGATYDDEMATYQPGDRVRLSCQDGQIVTYINDVRKFSVVETVVLTGNFVAAAIETTNASMREIRVGPKIRQESVTYRVAKTDYSYPSLIEMELIEEDLSVFTQFAPGALGEFPDQVILDVPRTIMYFLDTSIMGRSSDDNVGFYFAGGPPYVSTWPGASLFRSSDGDTYAAYAEFPSEVAAGGATSTLSYEGDIP